MRRGVIACVGVLLGPLTGASSAAETRAYTIGNRWVSRRVCVAEGRLKTAALTNGRADVTATPTGCDEFRLRLSAGTDTTGTDRILTAADFRVVDVAVETEAAAQELRLTLRHSAEGLRVVVRYHLEPGATVLDKQLVVTADRPVTLERIDVEALGLADAWQPYTVKAINARGKWSPGLGQPLYSRDVGLFWGVAFPAASNEVRDGVLCCGYLWGRTLQPGEPYTSYPAVMGTAADPAFVADAFRDYIERTRIRPFRLQVQYNSWFDYGRGVRRETFLRSVATIHRKLVIERGCEPLANYVIDDGWQDVSGTADWSRGLWPVNGKFDADFASCRRQVAAAGSELGLWLSPGCLFGAQRIVPRLRAQGFEALDDWMSLAGPRYMAALEQRLVGLTRQGISYFKLDGLFGHLNTRNFELHGDRYGLPTMPQLGLEGLSASDARLDDARCDELKTYYLVAGTERLMRIFRRMHAANPEVYIVISNGAWLSPWWLQSIDAVWMINAGDAARGADRTGELAYRDGVYYEIWRTERTQFPMHAIFNHEPKKRATGESADAFRRYLLMSLSRGTGFIELYLKTAVLQERDWDVLAEGLRWARGRFPAFRHVRLHGGDPRRGAVYGYAAWTRDLGYVSIHNPGDTERRYRVRLDGSLGLAPDAGPFRVSSPLTGSTQGLRERYGPGDWIDLRLAPREVRVLDFDRCG